MFTLMYSFFYKTMDERLSDAIRYGNDFESAKRVMLLIKEGVDVHRGDPLILSIQFNRLEIAKTLIAAEANTTKPDAKGKTPLYWAIEKGNLKMVELLLNNGAEFTMYENLEHAINGNNPEILRELIRRGVDVNSSHGRSDFPLITAVTKGKWQLLLFMIKNGTNLNLNVKNAANQTPLSAALSNHDFRTFQILIEYGADPKLAIDAIRAMVKKNPDFAAYMAKKAKHIIDPPPQGLTGHEAAS